MKVTKHGRKYTKSLPIKAACKCGCEMEVDELEMEGGSSHYVWCPECKDTVMISDAAIVESRRHRYQQTV